MVGWEEHMCSLTIRSNQPQHTGLKRASGMLHLLLLCGPTQMRVNLCSKQKGANFVFQSHSDDTFIVAVFLR